MHFFADSTLTKSNFHRLNLNLSLEFVFGTLKTLVWNDLLEYLDCLLDS